MKIKTMQWIPLFLSVTIFLTGCTTGSSTSSLPVNSSDVPSSSELPPSSGNVTPSPDRRDEWTVLMDYLTLQNINPDLSVLNGETICQIEQNNSLTFLVTESGRLFACGYGAGNRMLKGYDEQNRVLPSAGLHEISFNEKIKMTQLGLTSAVAVGESNTIYLWGSGFSGMKSVQDGIVANRNTIVTVPFHKEIANIAHYGTRVLILTTDGEVYGLGGAPSVYDYDLQNPVGLFGYKWNEDTTSNVHKIETPEPIVQICATSITSVMLGKSGKCYIAAQKLDESVWKEQKITDYPTKKLTGYPYLEMVDFDQTIVTVGISSIEMLYVVTENGSVYGAGINDRGHIGTGVPEKVNMQTAVVKEFQKINIPERVIQVGCTGEMFASFLTENGNLYVTGMMYGNYTLQDEEIYQNRYEQARAERNWDMLILDAPTKVNLPEPVVRISAETSTYFYQKADGSVWFIGMNPCGAGIAPSHISEELHTTAFLTSTEIKLQFSDSLQIR
jgi:alpha-tubulin suppressor-like RCC1 family protein